MAETEKKRTYYGKGAIVGQSGTGKSYLSKTADRKSTGYINFERKPAPYRSEPFKYEGKPSTWAGFYKNFQDYIANPEIKYIIVDSFTMALNTLIKEMGVKYTGYDTYKFYNRAVYDFLETLRNAEKDILILAHDELVKSDDGDKVKRIATHGREFDGKIEQHFNLVLYTGTRYKDGKPEYFLKTFEPNTSAKAPENMFTKGDKEIFEIPNDAAYIFKAFDEYYSI